MMIDPSLAQPATSLTAYVSLIALAGFMAAAAVSDARHKLVSNTLNGLDPVFTNFFPEFTDMHVDRPVDDVDIGAPDLFEEYFPRIDLSGL